MSSNSEECNAQSLFIKVQKKMASKFTSRSTMKMFSDKLSSRILDNLYKILRNYTGSKTTANQILKHIIGITVKLHILNQNKIFNEHETKTLRDLMKSISKAAKCFVDIGGPKYGYRNAGKLQTILGEIKGFVEVLAVNHLKEKSKSKIEFCSSVLLDIKFLEAILKNDELYNDYVEEICDDLVYLMDRQIL